MIRRWYSDQRRRRATSCGIVRWRWDSLVRSAVYRAGRREL